MEMIIMQYNNRAILGMIASALNPANPLCCYQTECNSDLTEIDTTPNRNALLFFMADGRQFQITVKEVL
jgi:hypothetical protein